MKIYTCSGDDGTTSLPGGKRIKKHDDRLEACGTVDELIAWIGVLKDHKENLERKQILIYIQDQLMRCVSAMSSDPAAVQKAEFFPEADCASRLENEIDLMQKKLKPLKNFILPGGNLLISNCHVARCVCRRAERRISKLYEKEITYPIILKFLNRLSDYLFVLARMIAFEFDIEEIRWPV